MQVVTHDKDLAAVIMPPESVEIIKASTAIRHVGRKAIYDAGLQSRIIGAAMPPRADVCKAQIYQHEFLEDRAIGVGASDVAAILGLSKYKTPRDVYASKFLGNIDYAPLHRQEAPLEWGTRLEPVIREAIAARILEEESVVARADGFAFMPDDGSRIRVHIDGIVFRNQQDQIVVPKVLEIKTVSGFALKSWPEIGSVRLPIEYYLQVQTCLHATGIHYAEVWILIDGRKLEGPLEIAYDPVCMSEILPKIAAFWEHVERNEPPEHTDATPAIDRFPGYDVNKQGHVEATPEIIAAVTRIQELRESKKIIETEIDELSEVVKNYIGRDEYLMDGGAVLAKWTVSSRTTLDTKRIKEEAPDIYERFGTTTETRSFTIK